MISIHQESILAKMIHYPECWDTAAYPDLYSALFESMVLWKCSNDDCVKAKKPSSLTIRLWPAPFGYNVDIVSGIDGRICSRGLKTDELTDLLIGLTFNCNKTNQEIIYSDSFHDSLMKALEGHLNECATVTFTLTKEVF